MLQRCSPIDTSKIDKVLFIHSHFFLPFDVIIVITTSLSRSKGVTSLYLFTTFPSLAINCFCYGRLFEFKTFYIIPVIPRSVINTWFTNLS